MPNNTKENLLNRYETVQVHHFNNRAEQDVTPSLHLLFQRRIPSHVARKSCNRKCKYFLATVLKWSLTLLSLSHFMLAEWVIMFLSLNLSACHIMFDIID